MKEYLVRFSSNSTAKIVKLSSEEYKEVVNMGYQVIPLGKYTSGFLKEYI